LEGKHVEVGDLKLQVRSVVAQGGFSSVYLAKDGATGKTYALKHIICNDAESVELVKKEVSVMKALRGHPNVVTLHGQVVYDLGRTKECFLVMEYCHKMLAHVLENRGAGFYDEKQILLMFLDICNAVYAMHCQSPPIAHRFSSRPASVSSSLASEGEVGFVGFAVFRMVGCVKFHLVSG
jgi:AP2-associated kinase